LQAAPFAIVEEIPERSKPDADLSAMHSGSNDLDLVGTSFEPVQRV
jgi:hypothetical protein